MSDIALDVLPTAASRRSNSRDSSTSSPGHDGVVGLSAPSMDREMSRSHSGQAADSIPDSTHDRLQEDEASALPPVDRGRGAWTFAVCSWTLEYMIWGSTFSLGVFQSYYTEEFGTTASAVSISAIGTCLAAFSYMTGPIITPVLRRYPYYMKRIAFTGLVFGTLSLVGASFANGVPALIALQGVGAGLGGGLAFSPVLTLFPQWFDKKRGLAGGIIFGASSIGGITNPFMYQACLDSLGWRWSLRLYALVYALCVPAVLLMNPRLPVRRPAAGTAGRPSLRDALKSLKSHVGFVSSPIYLMNAGTVFILSAGNLSITLYLSVYIKTAGYSSTKATAGLAILNAASAVGSFAIGNLCDRYSYTIVTVGIGAISALSTLLLFGLSTSIASILTFVVLFGATSGGYVSTWAASSGDVARMRSTQTASILMSYGAVKGVASLVGPLIAAALLQERHALDPAAPPPRAAFGSFGYALLVVWVGVCMGAAAALAGVVHVWRKKVLRGIDYSGLQERF